MGSLTPPDGRSAVRTSQACGPDEATQRKSGQGRTGNQGACIVSSERSDLADDLFERFVSEGRSQPLDAVSCLLEQLGSRTLFLLCKMVASRVQRTAKTGETGAYAMLCFLDLADCRILRLSGDVGRFLAQVVTDIVQGSRCGLLAFFQGAGNVAFSCFEIGLGALVSFFSHLGISYERPRKERIASTTTTRPIR
ncbi:hypothetical protein [Mesorhizobium sp. 1B3]|uniref:hypothetical protein n=1 Tax=Mesorhizobium sp. 1B3 TaxID=3243599 RepID=UPI003D9A0368